jgi:hypothetical protein
MGVSFEFRYPASDRAEPKRHHLWWAPRVLAPLPLFLVKPRCCWRIKKGVFILLAHFFCGSCPAGARPALSPNHDTPRLGIQFDFVRELSFVQKYFRQADPASITDLHNARLHVSLPRTYIVITLRLDRQTQRKLQACSKRGHDLTICGDHVFGSLCAATAYLPPETSRIRDGGVGASSESSHRMARAISSAWPPSFSATYCLTLLRGLMPRLDSR